MNKRLRQSCEPQAPASMEQQLLEDLLKTCVVTSIADTVKSIVEGQESESEKADLLQRSLALGRGLQKVSNSLLREHATRHNSHVWPFSSDLSVKIFSSLHARTICCAAATCTLFYKLYLDSSCYNVLDLSTVGSAVTDAIVAKMVDRAGSHLRTLKLGVVSQILTFPQFLPSTHAVEWADCSLSRHCLRPLIMGAGTTLQSLHLHNIARLDTKVLAKALAACPSLLELKLAGLNVNLNTTMAFLASSCLKLENLSCSFFPRQSISSRACTTLVQSCSRITSLTLSGCDFGDVEARVLMRGLQQLKYVEFSESMSLRGACLRAVPATLQSLILKDVLYLKESEVETFLYALIDGEYKALRHLELSTGGGLEEDHWRAKLNPELITRVQSLRPHLSLFADCLLRKTDSPSSDEPQILSDDTTSSESDVDAPDYLDEDEDDDDFVISLDEFLEEVPDSSGASDQSDSSIL